MPMLADIFTKKGAFLKLYSCYISEYDAICQLLDELRRKSSDFNNVVKRFEVCRLKFSKALF
jgi:FYVE/RhoGEF/PH domain-containing protein 5/6